MKQGEIRIIGGKWRSRRIKFPAVPGLRPTIDRVRETLFNWLTPYIVDSHCLDLFAGSGALGLEALSRGAEHVTFIDNNPQIIAALKTQIAVLDASHQTDIYCTKVPSDNILNKIPEYFDIVFIDPPFNQRLIQPICQWLEHQAWLAKNALIYLETEAKLKPLPIPATWEIIHSKVAGASGYHLAQRNIS